MAILALAVSGVGIWLPAAACMAAPSRESERVRLASKQKAT